MSRSKRTERPGSGEAWPLGQAEPGPGRGAASDVHGACARAAGGGLEDPGVTAEAFAARYGGAAAPSLRNWHRAAQEGRQLAEPSGRARNPTGRTRGAYSEAERVAAGCRRSPARGRRAAGAAPGSRGRGDGGPGTGRGPG
jgi:hypothetical protein